MYVDILDLKYDQVTHRGTLVERLRRTPPIMAGSKHGNPPRVLLHPRKRAMSGNLHPRLGRTGTQHIFCFSCFPADVRTWDAEQALGSVVAVL